MLIREITGEDVNLDFLNSLAVLYKGLPTVQKAKDIFRRRLPHVETYGAFEEKEVIGAIAIVYLQSFGHNGGLVARIEDVAVRGDHQNKGIGRALVEFAVSKAREASAYKVELSCKRHLIDFYTKCGFHEHETTMRVDFGTNG